MSNRRLNVVSRNRGSRSPRKDIDKLGEPELFPRWLVFTALALALFPVGLIALGYALPYLHFSVPGFLVIAFSVAVLAWPFALGATVIVMAAIALVRTRRRPARRHEERQSP